MKILKGELDEAVARFESLVGEEIATLNERLGKKEHEPIQILSRDDWAKRGDAGQIGATPVALSLEGVARFKRMFPVVPSAW